MTLIQKKNFGKNNASSSDLIIMDTQTGGWSIFWNCANNNSDYKRTMIYDFRVYTTVDI
jgi:hypothetical protein